MAALVIYGTCVEPYRIELHHVWIQDAYLGKVLGNKSVVHLSDLHIGRIGRREQSLLKILEELAPDVVFLTGDYVQWKGDYAAAVDFLSRLKATTGIWAVMGDYDYSSSRKSCLFCHDEGSPRPSSRHSVRFLRDTVEAVTLKEGTFRVEGLDIRNEMSSAPETRVRTPGNGKPHIILSHTPLVFDQIDSREDVLILAGDTHGGQIPLPSWLLMVMGYRKNALYSEGLFERGKKRMFVSRGIGTSHIPIRIFRRPEVVVLHFRQ